MRLTAKDWEELGRAASAGTARRRLFPACPHDVFLAVRHPHGIRMLTLGLSPATVVHPVHRRIDRLPRTSGLDLRLVTLSDGARELQLGLTDTSLLDVFNVLVGDVAAAVAEAPPGASALCLVERVDRWIRMLRVLGADGLSEERRRGVFGELHMLQQLLAAGVEEHVAVAAWTGPEDAHQDFQMSGLAIEVKTSAGRQPGALPIASERQLDATGCGRLLLGHLLVDERRGGDGTSLNEKVAVISEALMQAGPRGRFDELVVRAGRLPHQVHLYDEPRYTVRTETLWQVEGDFPRVTEAELRPGVGSCTYRISTAGLERFAVAPETLGDLVKGAGIE